MTVAPATSQKRIEANRRNAQRSTGPRTPEGKSRSRFNGLKHGLTAKVPVIPGEDAAVYQERLDAIIESCAPQNQVELELLGRLAATNWSLDRAARAEAAQISQRVRNYAIERERREEEEAVALGQRLFWDARGPWQAYPHRPHTGLQHERRTSWSEDPADGNHPALLVLRLERTVAGCRWLLERWAELRSRLEPDEMWSAPDQFKAFRLLGKQPLDAVDDRDVALICMASVKLLPPGCEGTDPFDNIGHELRKQSIFDPEDQHTIYARELWTRPHKKLWPADADAARAALRALIDRQTARLKLVLARNQEIAEADAAEAPDRLAFDPSPEGEKLRRYMLSAARVANQTTKQFLSVVRCPLSVETEDSGGGLEDVGENAFALDWAYANPFAKRKATISAGEASPEDLRSERNTPPAMAQPVTSFDPEPLRHGGPAPLRSEPITPPAEPQSRPIESPTGGSTDSPLAPTAIRHGGPTTMSGVRGSETDPSAPAPRSLRTEPNAAVEKSQPTESHALHRPPETAAVSDPTMSGRADLEPFDVTNRRYFGAQMSAARAALAESQGTSQTNPYRSSSRKPNGRRRQN
jgi:hypothetical protein